MRCECTRRDNWWRRFISDVAMLTLVLLGLLLVLLSFDNISYCKGSVLIRMLHAYLGDAAFRQGLSTYLRQYSYSNSVTADLWRVLSESSGRDVSAMMSQWALQMGFPLIHVKSIKHDAATQKISMEVTQRRFLLTGPAGDKDEAQ
jgi:aminopeptidase N